MKRLTGSTESQLSADVARSTTDKELIEELQKMIGVLRRELAGANDRFKQLNEQYVKISDMWNAFQSLHKLEPRDVIRAEQAGEMARKLATVLIKLAYNVDDPMGLLR